MSADTILKYMKFSYESRDYIIRLHEEDSMYIKKVYKIMNMALKRGIEVQSYLPIKGRPYFVYQDELYTLIRDYDKHTEIDEYELGEMIAKFHKIKGSKLNSIRIYTTIQNEYKLLKYYKDLVKFKKTKGDIDNLMFKLIEINEDGLEDAYRTLSSSKIIDKIDRDIQSKSIIHNGLRRDGIVIQEGNICLSAMDIVRNGTAMEDVADMVLNLLESHIDIRVIDRFLKGYDSVRTISKLDYKILISLLKYPKELFNILDNYTMGHTISTKIIKDYIVDMPLKEKIIGSIETSWGNKKI